MSNSINETIATIKSRTLADRRIAQAEARIAKAIENNKLDADLIEAIKAHRETLPIEAGSLTAVAGDKITFKTGRAESTREERGVVQLVDGVKYKVLVGEGFNQEFKTIFGGQITSVEPAATEDSAAIDADELGL